MGIRRLSERESNLRRYYRKHFCDRVNNPMRFLPNLVARNGKLVTPSKDEPNPLEDSDFLLDDVAHAIIDVVKGEEDRNRELYEEGAELIIRMDEKYKPRESLALGEKLEWNKRSKRLEKAQSTQPGDAMVELEFSPGDFVQAYSKLDSDDPMYRKKLQELVKDTPPFSESQRLFEMFRDYLRRHKRFLRLGVCHYWLCNKLYVKSKHSSERSLYCSDDHKNAAKRERAKKRREKDT